MKIGEAEGGIDDVRESSQTSVWERTTKRIDACEPEARIDQAFSDLLPLPLLHASAVMYSIVADDTRIGHTFFFRRKPLDLRRRAEEEQADTTNEDSHRAEEVGHPSPRFRLWVCRATLANTVQCQA